MRTDVLYHFRKLKVQFGLQRRHLLGSAAHSLWTKCSLYILIICNFNYFPFLVLMAAGFGF